jgi:3D (Asp-Asp-Asp) domain-containing protein
MVLSVAKRGLTSPVGLLYFPYNKKLDMLYARKGVFCWKSHKPNMKKFTTQVVIAVSFVYYAFLPLFTAKADSPFLQPSLAGNATGASTLAFNEVIPVATTTIFYMRVTAYASVPDETDSTPFITANGTHVYYGEAASNILPFGTKIQIPGLFGSQIFTIEDRMSTKIKNTIDIWMPSVSTALHFGMSHTDIVILSEPTSTFSLAIK